MSDQFKKFPALYTVVPLVAGILISFLVKKEVLALEPLHSRVLILILALIGIISYSLFYKSSVFRYIYFITLMAIGFVSFQNRFFIGRENSISAKINDDKIIIKGTVGENPEIKEQSIRILMDDISIECQAFEGMILASVYRNKFKENQLQEIKYGDIIEIEGKLENLPHRRNPGEFDYGQYLKMHDIDAVFYTYGYDKIKIIGNSNANFYKKQIINPVREYSIKTIDNIIGGDEGEYLKGLVLGEKSNISTEIKENFINDRVAHIIAVSGLNVAYVLIIIWALLIFIPVKQNYKIFISILLLIFYMNLTGNTPSIVRATIMASVFLLARVFERKTNSYNVIAFAALVILLIAPRQLFDAGFILSFSAILSIIIFYPVIDKWLNSFSWYANINSEKITGKSLKFILALFFGTLAAQIGTLPITAIMFKKISVVSLIANLFAIPLS